MKRINILIISRLTLPSIDPRAYRSTELAKEFARQGHDVTLYAVLGKFDYQTFESDHKLKVKNIGKMIFATLNSDGTKRLNILDKILFRLFYRLIEYPDIELMFRILRIIKSEKKFDLLISVAAPYPIHWGCALARTKLKNSFPSLWIADCGDPYMGNKGPGLKRKFFYFKYIEKWFCTKADYLAVPIEGAKEAYFPEFRNKIRVIPQGFRYDNVNLCSDKSANEVPTFAYSGFFYYGIRDPSIFLQYLTTLNRKFKFVVYTKNTEFFVPYLKLLGDKIEIREYVPRENLLYELSKMDFLVNFENTSNFHSPSKLIDYALVKNPILSIPPNSLPVDIVNEFLDGNYQNQLIITNLEQYNIKEVAKKFISLTH